MTAPLDELAGALAKFQAEVPVVPKKQTAKIETQGGRNYSYTYADLATISPVVMPLLAKHGLAFTALPTARKDGPPVLVGMLIHTSGQSVKGELPITGRTPQEIGSSLTYGRRYLLGCLTGVVTDDDDDGGLATRAAKKTDRPPGVDPQPPVAPPIPIQRKARKPVTGEPAPGPSGPPTGRPAPTGTGSAPDPKPTKPTESMRRALFAAIGEALPEAQRVERLALCSAVTGRRVESSEALTAREVSSILAWVDDFRAGREAYTYEPELEIATVWPVDPPPEDTGP